MKSPDLTNPYFKPANVSSEWCPRCNRPLVSKLNRCCMGCGGRLVWPDDECLIKHLDSLGDDWYMFYRGVSSVPSWHHSSYFRPMPKRKK